MKAGGGSLEDLERRQGKELIENVQRGTGTQ